MYAIAKIAGKQFRIEPDHNLKVPRLSVQEGSTFEIAEILLASDGGKIKIGQPVLKGFKATAKVVSHGRDPKIIVFRKKRRKGFKVTRGHRQGYTLLHIEEIQGLTAKPKAAEEPKAEAKPKPTAKPKTTAKPKAAAKPRTAAKPKTQAKPKSSTKKEAPKSEKSSGE